MIVNQLSFLYLVLLLPFDALTQIVKCPLPPLPTGVICKIPVVKGKFYTCNIVQDFGADPTGKTNSQEAFECAAWFFNQNGGNGKLIIPYGIYNVGKQTFIGSNRAEFDKTGGVGWAGRHLFYITECINFTIEGLKDKKTRKQPSIKFSDGLKLGGITKNGEPSDHFEKEGTRYTIPNDFEKSAKTNTYRSSPATFFLLENCINIQINNISIDGNCKNYILGSYYGVGQAPYEMWCNGIEVFNTVNLKVDRVKITDMGCDGIIVRNYATDPKSKKNDNIVVSNCDISFCGRNNISWVGGYGLVVQKTSLTNAGMGRSKTDPGAGIDIEPENHDVRLSRCEYVRENGQRVLADDYCINGKIIDCYISDNRVSGILNASDKGRTLNCIVINTHIESKTEFSLTVVNENVIRFENSTLKGRLYINKKESRSPNSYQLFRKTTFQ